MRILTHRLADLAPKGTVMVVTDYDLTRKGMRGFQGSAVQSWCQRNLIPVGDFSRGHPHTLPEEPNLFGMNIPVETTAAAASYVAATYHGFTRIRAEVSAHNTKNRSISAITANILGRSSYEPVLSLYFSRLASSNTGVRHHLQQRISISKSEEHDLEDTLDVLAYVIGHVVLNLILVFPGPSCPAKCWQHISQFPRRRRMMLSQAQRYPLTMGPSQEYSRSYGERT